MSVQKHEEANLGQGSVFHLKASFCLGKLALLDHTRSLNGLSYA